ncbi:MAG: hypothetical protein V1715_16220 [bacterium]
MGTCLYFLYHFNCFECYDANTGNKSTNGTQEPKVPIVDRGMGNKNNPRIYSWDYRQHRSTLNRLNGLIAATLEHHNEKNRRRNYISGSPGQNLPQI